MSLDISIDTLDISSNTPSNVIISINTKVKMNFFQENTFIKSKLEGSIVTAGSLCKNLEAYNNVIRKNIYKKLYVANAANGKNTIIGTINEGKQGLNYECNKNLGMSIEIFGFLMRVFVQSKAKLH